MLLAKWWTGPTPGTVAGDLPLVQRDTGCWRHYIFYVPLVLSAPGGPHHCYHVPQLCLIGAERSHGGVVVNRTEVSWQTASFCLSWPAKAQHNSVPP